MQRLALFIGLVAGAALQHFDGAPPSPGAAGTIPPEDTMANPHFSESRAAAVSPNYVSRMISSTPLEAFEDEAEGLRLHGRFVKSVASQRAIVPTYGSKDKIFTAKKPKGN